MRIKYLVLFAFVCFASSVFAQRTLDVLETEFIGDKNSVAYIDTILQELRYWEYRDYTEAINMAKKVIEISDNIKDRSKLAIGHFELGLINHYHRKLSEANTNFSEAENIYNHIGDRKGYLKSKSLRMSVLMLDYPQIVVDSLDLITEELFELGDSHQLSVNFFNLGLANFAVGSNTKVVNDYFASSIKYSTTKERAIYIDGYSYQQRGAYSLYLYQLTNNINKLVPCKLSKFKFFILFIHLRITSV